jgi:adenylosuccinate synthase
MNKYNSIRQSHINMIKALGYNEKDFQIEKKSLEEYEKEWFSSIEKLRKMKVINTEYYLNEQINKGKKVLAEGAQGTMLDIDFGSYPFVTSSSTVTAGVCSGLGIAPSKIGRVFGIVKAYCTRVGSGPFPTELFDNDGEELCQKGREFGATTGRKRRCGWLDMVALNYACMLNGVTDIMLMKIDVLNDFPTIKICEKYKIKGEETTCVPYNMEADKIDLVYKEYKGWQKSVEGTRRYEDLPKEMQDYIQIIEKETNVPVSVVSISPDRDDTIFRNNIKK